MSTSEDAEADLSRPPRSRAVIWGWVGVAVLVAIASVFGWQAAQQPVRWTDVGFSIDSPTQATAEFEVYLYKNRDATCYVRALNSKFAEVGLTEVHVAAADGSQQRLTAVVATTEKATTAVVKYCVADG